MERTLAPIVYFAYNRPGHTLQTLEALSNNRLANASDLWIYLDGPKATASAKDLENMVEVRRIAGQKKWCKNVTIIASEKNKGLIGAITQGITEVVNKYGKVIIVEDDVFVSPGFLEYMNDALSLYENTPEVMHVSGFSLPEFSSFEKDQSTYFFNHTSCWGWGTWKRAWDLFDKDAAALMKQVKAKDIYRLNMDGTLEVYWGLKAIADGKRQDWNPNWHTTVFLNNGLCLHPYRSLVKNIGHDGSGVNCAPTDRFDATDDIADKIVVEQIPLKEDIMLRKYHRKIRSKDRRKIFVQHYLRYLRF